MSSSYPPEPLTQDVWTWLSTHPTSSPSMVVIGCPGRGRTNALTCKVPTGLTQTESGPEARR